MPFSKSENLRIAEDVNRSHKPSAILCASLLLLTAKLFRHHGHASSANLESLISFQGTCVETWARTQGLELWEIEKAVAALKQAERTSQVLAQMDQVSSGSGSDHVPGVSCFTSTVSRPMACGRCVVCGFSVAPRAGSGRAG